MIESLQFVNNYDSRDDDDGDNDHLYLSVDTEVKCNDDNYASNSSTFLHSV